MSERLTQVDTQHGRVASSLANIISKMQDHTIDDKSLQAYCMMRREQLGLPADEQEAQERIREGLSELSNTRIITASSVGGHSINQFLLNAIPLTYGGHLGADVLTRLYEITNYSSAQNPALTFHQRVAPYEMEIDGALRQSNIPESSIRQAKSMGSLISNMHLNVEGIAKREHIIRHFTTGSNYSQSQLINAITELHKLGILHRTELGYYSLSGGEVESDRREALAAEANAKIDRETLRQKDTISIMKGVVDFVKDYRTQLDHTFRLKHLHRLWEQVYEDTSSAPIADLPSSPKDVDRAFSNLRKVRVLTDVPSMERGVYQIAPNLQTEE